jgi:hypothetical protein
MTDIRELVTENWRLILSVSGFVHKSLKTSST